MPQQEERFMQMEINFVLGKNGGYKPSGSGGKAIIVASEWDEILAVYDFFKIDNFNSKACLGCLNRFILLMAL